LGSSKDAQLRGEEKQGAGSETGVTPTGSQETDLLLISPPQEGSINEPLSKIDDFPIDALFRSHVDKEDIICYI
jgi:hypothetical protein